MWGRIRLALAVLLAPFVLAFVYESCLFVVSNLKFYLASFVTYGFLVYAIIYLFISRFRIGFFETLEHEFGHAAAGVFLGMGIRGLLVRPKEEDSELVAWEGETKLVGHGCYSVARLTPYCMPLLSIPLVAIRLFVLPSVEGVIDFLIGFSLAFHVVALIREFRFYQPDIKDTGRLFSLNLVSMINTFVLVAVPLLVCGDYSSISNYLKQSVVKGVEVYRTIYEIWKALDDVSS